MYKGVNVEDDTPPSLWQRTVLPNLFYNMVVLALLITTVVLSANTLGRVEEVSTCRLRYEGDANDLTEQQFQVLATQQGWTLTHPEPPDCNRCGLNVDQRTNDVLYPVWLAPVDICNVFGLSPTHPFCDRATYQLPQSHVKVCATQTQINEVWAAGGCHRTNATDGSERPIVGYDGNLFCCDESTPDVQHPSKSVGPNPSKNCGPIAAKTMREIEGSNS